MVKVQAKIDFFYRNYNKIKNLNSVDIKEKGRIFTGDTFEVEEKEAEYLAGDNQKRIVAVKVLEVIPEIKEEKKITTKGKTKNNKKEEDK